MEILNFRAATGRGWVLSALALACALAGCDGSPHGSAALADGSAVAPTASVKAALPPAQANAATWTAPIGISLVPAAGAVLANGKVMLWAADSRTNFGGGGHTYTTLFDPATNTAVERNVTNTSHDMFCPGTSRLPDGRLLVNGGLDAGSTSIYDPATDTWTAAQGMNIPRGYNASATLQDGTVMTLGGSWSGANGGVRNAEVFTLGSGWRLLSNVPEDPYRLNVQYSGWQTDSHNSLIPASNGRVLVAGPAVNMYWIDTAGNGTSTFAGKRGDDIPAFGGPMVMYEAGKILKVGGSGWNNGDNGSALSYIIDTTGGTAAVTKLPSMAYGRLYANSVVLPNGQVLVVGGQTVGNEFSDSNAVLAPELFDPATNTFTVLPSMSVARNYHSIALLLPDARVMSAGGGLCDCSGDHKDLQILTPPYLYNADGSPATRPQIVSAPAKVGYGTTATVTTNSSVTAFSLVRIGANTHTVNNNQRRVSLSFTAQGGNSYALNIPTNPGILIPGQWMLFALNAQGTPSIAAVVLVDNTGAPVVKNPGSQTAQTNTALYLPLTGTSTKTLTWSALNLPAGLTMDPSGFISGAPLAAGTAFVTILAADGTQTVSTDFLMTVTGTGTGPGYHTPTLNAVANQSTALGTTVSLSPSASDPDGNPLTWSATGLPPGLNINALTGVITGTANTAGTFSVVLKVVNGGNLSATTPFSWTVVAGLPTVVSLPAPIAATNATVSYAPVITGGSTAASYSYDFGDGSGATAFSASPNATHAYAAPGIYTVTFFVALTDGRNTSQSFIQAIYPPGASALARASANLMVEPRSGANARLWVVNQDNDTVSVFDSVSGTKAAEIAVGASPRSVALGSDGNIWVSNKLGGTLSKISPASLTVSATIALPRASQPFGIVVSPADGSLFVALEGTGQVLKLNTAGAQLGAVNIGNNPRQLALTSGGDQLMVSRFITRQLPGEGTATVSTTDGSGNALGGEVVVVNTASLAVVRTYVLANSTRADAENQGRGLPNYLGAAAISPDGKTAWVPSKQDNILRGTLRDGNGLNFQNTVRSISSRIDLTSNTEDLTNRIDHDNAGLASAALYHPTGVYLFVALETNRQVAVVDVAGKRELFRYEVGLAPQGLALSADGLKLYVSNFMDRSVSVVDLLPLTGFGQTTGAAVATWKSVATEKLAATVLKGKQLFYDARDTRLARDSYMSCAVCHNDGGFDGRTWDFTGQGEGLRNTIALKGRGGMGQGFLHWSANFDELQDFEGQIRTLAGGTGLMTDAQFNTATRNQPLGTTKAGVSADLDALAAYLTSLNVFPSSPYRNADGTLTAAAVAGKTVFTTSNCASCHGSTGFTLSADGTLLKDIGTLKPSSGARNGGALPGIDIPTLRDVWATPPYLHDGSATSLSDAIAAHNAFNLSATDLANVAEYVREIGGEEPAINASVGTLCAAEWGACVVPAGVIATVSFGANGMFAQVPNVTGSIDCNYTVFGDPAFGFPKSCYYLQTGVVGGGTPPPVVTLSALPATIASGATSTLTWTSTNATACTASNGWAGAQALSGTIATAALTASTTYTLTCTGAGGTSAANATVTVTGTTPAPTVTLTAAPASIASGATSTLTWASTNATACAATGGWTGAKAVSGTAVTAALTASTTYTLSCTGAGGTGMASATVTVTGTTTPAPTVTLTAAPVSVASGATSTLTWSSTNATACTATGGWTGARAISGTAPTAALTATTTYTLSCTGAGGTTAANATVTVTGGTTPGTLCAAEWGNCTLPAGVVATVSYGAKGLYFQKTGVTGSIGCSNNVFGDPASGLAKSCYYVQTNGGTPAPTVTLTAAPATIASGATSTLTWSSTNATACTASGGWTGAQAVTGTAPTAALTASTTYTLTCTGTGGTGAASATVTVAAGSPAPTVTLTAAPASIASGATSTLTWSSTNATACTASNGWTGAQPLTGSAATAALTASTTFTLTCTGAGGTAAANATVTVTAATPAPTVTLTANPTSIASGATSTLTWSSTNATTCTAANGWAGAKATSGTVATAALTATTTYSLSCTGPGGTSAAANAVVTVTAATPAPTVTLTAAPASIASGATSTLTWASTNATACTATGGWTGAKATAGSAPTPALTASTAYTLTCTGAGGSATANATVTVAGALPGTRCASEWGACVVPAGVIATVSFGANGLYAQITNVTGSIDCNFQVFGDPASGLAKSCYYLQTGTVTGTTPAPTVTLTAAPNSVASGGVSTLTWSSTNATTCTASGSWTGVKGASGTFTTPALTASASYTLTCTGVGGTSAPANTVVNVMGTGVQLGTLCAAEWGACVVPQGVVATVSYGGNGLYAQKTNVTGTIACNNPTFGDPAPNASKSCYYLQTGTTGP